MRKRKSLVAGSLKQPPKIAVIAGARPNFMKIVPLVRAFKKAKLPFFVVNTGQHFSERMSGQFFKDFGIKPKYSFSAYQGGAVEQLCHIMSKLGKCLRRERPSLVVVSGDVNSTLYGALAAYKSGIPLAHIEAGLRSRNYAMPEEINRILVDHLADLLFATEKVGLKNLAKEKVKGEIYLVGNIMIDTLKMFLPFVKKTKEKFYFCTLHRAENVDNRARFKAILDALEVISHQAPIYLPLHPRTEKMAKKFGYLPRMKKIFKMTKPLSYQETLFYENNAKLILTDSGGVQEEASVLGTACLTLRTETERPITLQSGSNVLAGVTTQSILNAYRRVSFSKKKHTIPLWDGKVSERIVEKIKKFLA